MIMLRSVIGLLVRFHIFIAKGPYRQHITLIKITPINIAANLSHKCNEPACMKYIENNLLCILDPENEVVL